MTCVSKEKSLQPGVAFWTSERFCHTDENAAGSADGPLEAARYGLSFRFDRDTHSSFEGDRSVVFVTRVTKDLLTIPVVPRHSVPPHGRGQKAPITVFCESQ